jgi:hypothetical protein
MPATLEDQMTVEQYVNAIRNEVKRAYAENYLAYLRGHIQGEPDRTAYALSAMAAQAVRMQLHELLPTLRQAEMAGYEKQRHAELIQRYAYPGATLAEAEKAASGYMIMTNESQPVDDETLAADIDEMRAELGIR